MGSSNRHALVWTGALVLIVGAFVATPARAQDETTTGQDTESAAPGQTEETAAQEDEGPALPQYTRFFYFQPFLGYSWADGGALGGNDTNLPDTARLESSGLNVGAALGFKIFVLQLGARATYAFHEDYDLGGIMGELGVRIPIPVFEPIVRLGAGFGWLNIKNTLGDILEENPSGFLLDIGLGFDVWLGSNFTLGFDGAVGLYFLARDSIECLRAGDGLDCTVREDADNAGALQIRLQLTLGFWA